MAKLSSDGKYVTVQKGDSLWSIAAEHLGDGNKWKTLAAANSIEGPKYIIYVGEKIYLSKQTSSSGSGGSSSSSTAKKTSSKKVTNIRMGLQSDSDNTLFVTWDWTGGVKDGKDRTENYRVIWSYYTGDGVWFIGNDGTTDYKQSTYTIPSNATQVRVKVLPIAKKRPNGSAWFTAEWCDYKTYKVVEELETPAAPTVELNNLTLTSSLTGLTEVTHIEFKIVKNDKSVCNTKTVKVNYPVSNAEGNVEYSYKISTGIEYTVCCRSIKGKIKSDWSPFSSPVINETPTAPEAFTTLKALSENEVFVDWEAVKNATEYQLEYTTKTRYFDSNSEMVTSKSYTKDANGTLVTNAKITGMETGQEYFFRLRAGNNGFYSKWGEIESIIIGKAPAAPTTWSSTSTFNVDTDEYLRLYWTHNSEDNSSLEAAQIQLWFDGVKQDTIEVGNIYTTEDDKYKTQYYDLTWDEIYKVSTLKWRVRTAGILVDSNGNPKYGDWSVIRTIKVYRQPVLNIDLLDGSQNVISTTERTVTSFPFYIKLSVDGDGQRPIGYNITISSEQTYNGYDDVGNEITVKPGDIVYSQYFNSKSNPFSVKFTPKDLNIVGGISYKITASASTNSGLSAEAEDYINPTWEEEDYTPNGSITIDPEDLTATISMYCEKYDIYYSLVNYDPNTDTYTDTGIVVDGVYGEIKPGAYLQDGSQVLEGVDSDGNDILFYEANKSRSIGGVLLSVYRREFDGKFTEISTNHKAKEGKTINVVDPHPALDYARYRLVAESEATGSMGYYDLPAHPVDEKAIIIQWDNDDASFFEIGDDYNGDALSERVYNGTMLKLPYNIDVSDSNDKDVALVEYVGREHPVTYYGTQLGVKSTWSVEVPKDDEETLYKLRRLMVWMGDAYVREPSGTGYWANVSVSFSQTHREMTIPVTLNITRVEGGA